MSVSLPASKNPNLYNTFVHNKTYMIWIIGNNLKKDILILPLRFINSGIKKFKLIFFEILKVSHLCS